MAAMLILAGRLVAMCEFPDCVLGTTWPSGRGLERAGAIPQTITAAQFAQQKT
jgi:hypothetical protein